MRRILTPLPNVRRLAGVAALGAGLSLTAGIALAADDASEPPFKGHAAWVYDTLNVPGKPREIKSGFFVDTINRYNEQAGIDHRIRTIYSYHGSLELYCPGRKAERCRKDDMIVSFATPAGADGKAPADSSVARYGAGLKAQPDAPAPHSVAIIDGVVNANYAGSMKGFNELPQAQAEAFADKTAAALCQNPHIDGVQFDIEPLDVSSKNGQYYFYRRIAELFAGAAGEGAPDCQRADGQGLYFSLFAPVRSLNPSSASAGHLKEILTAHDNGYLIAPIYDLDATPLGHATSLADYRRQASQQLRQLQAWGSAAGVPFKVGIPAAASVHEYVRCEGPPCRNTQAAPSSQLDYVKAVLDAVDSSGVRDNPLFMGNVIWAWSRGISHGGARFLPDQPPQDVLSHLRKNL